MENEIKKKYISPTPLLYLYRGKDGILNTLTSRDFNHASEIKLTKSTNETNKLVFKVPFCEDRKVDYDSCELLTKFEGEYYIIKNVVTDSSNLSSEVNCVHESEALKGIYCHAQKCIGSTPQEMFNSIVSSTTHPIDLGIKWAGCDVDINTKRHLITEDEASVYENFVSLAKVFNGAFEIYNDENDQRWFYLRTKTLDKGRKFKSELDLKSVNVEYDSSEIMYNLYPTGYTNEMGIQLDVQEASQNPTHQSIISNFSYPLAKGVPTSIIDKEAQYQQFKTLPDENYINADDLWIFAQEELKKCSVPTLNATISITDLSAYVDSSLDDLDLMEKILCIDKEIKFVFECQIVGIEKDYDNPLQTELTISNLIRYDTDFQNINHTVDTVNKIVNTNPFDTNGVASGDGKPYISTNSICDGDHWNTQKIFEDLYAKTIFQANQIALKVEQLNKSYAELNMSCNNISSVVEEYNKSISKIEQNASSIVSTVESLDDTVEKSASKIEQYSDSIKCTVYKGEFGSVLEQNPRSLQLTFNKMNKYFVVDDTKGLCLGDRTTGSYSSVGYDGRLSLKVEGEKNPYHCMTEVGTSRGGNCGDADEDYILVDTITLGAKFDTIPLDEMSATCSIAKAYDSSTGSQCVQYWSGAYCEITGSDNGRKGLNLYAISTWRHYTVEEGVFSIESAVGGKIDISYIVIA